MQISYEMVSNARVRLNMLANSRFSWLKNVKMRGREREYYGVSVLLSSPLIPSLVIALVRAACMKSYVPLTDSMDNKY